MPTIEVNHLAVHMDKRKWLRDMLIMVTHHGIPREVENLLMRYGGKLMMPTGLMLLLNKYQHQRIRGNIENRKMMLKFQS